MKRLALLAVLLVGCTVNRTTVVAPTTTTVKPAPTTTSAPATTTTVRATTTTLAELDEEAFYLMFVKDETSLEWEYSDYDILQFGHGFCDMLDNGYSPDDIFMAMAEIQIEQGLTDTFVGDIATAFGAAVPAFCPEYSYLL